MSDAPRSRIVAPLAACLAACLALAALTACGGGDSGSAVAGTGASASIASSSSSDVTTTPTWTQGVYAPSSGYAAQCAAPRPGTSDRAGSVLLENFWLRSWTHEFYLWSGEVPDLAPASYATTAAYFDLQRTPAIRSNGRRKDPDAFHFTYATAAWQALSQSGVSPGYGVEWALVASAPPRQALVAYTEPGSPAATAGLTRGVSVLSVDGVDLVNDNTAAGIATLNAGLWPSGSGQTHAFVVRELNGQQHAVTMTSAAVTSTPVQNVRVLATGTGNVGYLQFNDHIATAEKQLISAVTTLRAANISDLVLDIRYNGGGYLDIASELATMIAGTGATSGKVFERLTFNSQYPASIDPVMGGANTPTPFYTTALGLSAATGTVLPTLNLPRVFVITGSGTCSASESIINGLRGVGVQVIQIGSSTCGKPYGFYPQDNCGTTYFSIEFQGVNDQGFGDYPDGFSPANTTGNAGVLLSGCSVADDFTHALGDTSEGRLSAALYYRSNARCPGPASGSSGQLKIQSYAGAYVDLSAVDAVVPKNPWRENRILRH